MCIPKPPRDNSAEIARAEEAARQARIKEGQAAIDKSFGKFDDSYFGNIEKASNDYYLPQVDQQFADARKRLIFNLARNNKLESSSGIEEMGRLQETGTKNRAAIGDSSRDLALGERNRVAGNKSTLISQLSASADPAAAAATATANADALSAPQTFSPLANLFAQFANVGVTGLAAEKAGYPGFGTGLFTPKPASTVVR